MKQYTRIYRDMTGNVTHVHTQTTPIRHEAVESDEIEESEDGVVESSNKGLHRARDILDSLSIRNNRAALALSEATLRPLNEDERKETADPVKPPKTRVIG